MPGERDVRHARHRDVLGHGAFRVALGNGAQIGSGELAVARGNRFAFVADMLGCARLVNIDMPAIGAHDALPRAKRMCDERDVGLCSAYDVVHRGIGACSRLLDERASPLAPFVELVARIRFRIRRLQRLENFGYRAMAVVVIQSNHECTSFLQTLPSYKKAALAGNLACSLAHSVLCCYAGQHDGTKCFALKSRAAITAHWSPARHEASLGSWNDLYLEVDRGSQDALEIRGSTADDRRMLVRHR